MADRTLESQRVIREMAGLLSTFGHHVQGHPEECIPEAEALYDALFTEQAREIERLESANNELESRNRQLRARLGAYREYLIMRPFNVLAIQHSDVPVEVPTPESLLDILDELDRLRAAAQGGSHG